MKKGKTLSKLIATTLFIVWAPQQFQLVPRQMK